MAGKDIGRDFLVAYYPPLGNTIMTYKVTVYEDEWLCEETFADKLKKHFKIDTVRIISWSPTEK